MGVDRDGDVCIDMSVDRGYGVWHVVRDTVLGKNKANEKGGKDFENQV